MNLTQAFLHGLLWHVPFLICGTLYAVLAHHIMYSRALRQLMEERKHQRQLELIELQRELEQRHHGTVTVDLRDDRDGFGRAISAGSLPDYTEGEAAR